MRIKIVRKIALCLLFGILLAASAKIIVSQYGVTYFSTFKPHSHWAQIGLFSAANLFGKAEAHWDSLTGAPRWKANKDANEMERLLKERYQVQVDRYTTDSSSPWWLGYTGGYNGVASGQVDKEHGAGAFHALQLEVSAYYKSQLEASGYYKSQRRLPDDKTQTLGVGGKLAKKSSKK